MINETERFYGDTALAVLKVLQNEITAVANTPSKDYCGAADGSLLTELSNIYRELAKIYARREHAREYDNLHP